MKNNLFRALLSYSLLMVLGIGGTYALEGRLLFWPASILVVISNFSIEKRANFKRYIIVVIAITASVAYLFFRKFLPFGVTPFVLDTVARLPT